MPQENDFATLKGELNGSSKPFPGPPSDITHFRIPPILQLHLKRAWITGLAIDPVSLAKEITQIDPRVEKEEVIRFLNQHIFSEEWTTAREASLNKSYQAMLLDSEKVREHIDQRYDAHFQKITSLCVAQLDKFASLSETLPKNEPLSPKAVTSVKSITLILKEAYLMQRLARGMSQGKYTHEIVQENKDFEEALTLLKERLNEKIIDAQARVLPSV